MSFGALAATANIFPGIKPKLQFDNCTKHVQETSNQIPGLISKQKRQQKWNKRFDISPNCRNVFGAQSKIPYTKFPCLNTTIML